MTLLLVHRMFYCSAVLLFSFLIVFIEYAAALTTCNVRPDFSNYSTPTTGNALSGSLYIDVNNPFTCYGILKKWRFCYRRSPSIQSDTLKIGLYKLEGNTYKKRSSNLINIQLKDSECLVVDANPELVVEQGYVVAFIATSAYIKFYDDQQYGHLFKTVAFPNQVSNGVLIKTSSSYAPKLQGYVELLQSTDTTTTTTSSESTPVTTSTAAAITETTTKTTTTTIATHSTLAVASTKSTFEKMTASPDLAMNSSVVVDSFSDIIIPSTASLLPIQSSSERFLPSLIPYFTVTSVMASSTVVPTKVQPQNNSTILSFDVEFGECALGIQNGYVSSFAPNQFRNLNLHYPSTCEGNVSKWELCYQNLATPTDIYLSIWRYEQDTDSYTIVGENTIKLFPRSTITDSELVCMTVTGNIQDVSKGDVIGFISPKALMAFATKRFINSSGVEDDLLVPIVRAIIDTTSSTFSSLPFSNTATVNPSQQASSEYLLPLAIGMGCAGLIVVILIMVIVIIVIIVRLIKLQLKYRTAFNNRENNYMVYNVNYIPSRRDQIIVDNQRCSISDLKRNPSYAVEEPLYESM